MNVKSCFLSFSILDGTKNSFSSSNHQMFLAVKTPENYNALQNVLQPTLDEINQLILDGHLNINGMEVKVDFYSVATTSFFFF